MHKRLLLLLFLNELIFSAYGIIYFVSPDGRDTNIGTSQATSFKTISAAALKVVAGDAVYISAGIYSERVTPIASGTATAPITFKTYNKGAVILTSPLPDIPNETKLYAFILTNRNYIVIDGIDFKDCNGWIYIDRANHNTLKMLRN